MEPRAGWPLLTARLALRALVSPRLALDLVRLAWSSRARDWYRRAPFLPLPPREYVRWRMFTAYGDEDATPRRAPFLPLPPREYVRWRMFTAYGDEDATPPLEDVVRFARWRRETMRL